MGPKTRIICADFDTVEVDPITCLITNFGDCDTTGVYQAIKAFILTGSISADFTALLNYWADQCNFSENQRLVMQSGAFPQLVLLSLVEFSKLG